MIVVLPNTNVGSPRRKYGAEASSVARASTGSRFIILPHTPPASESEDIDNSHTHSDSASANREQQGDVTVPVETLGATDKGTMTKNGIA